MTGQLRQVAFAAVASALVAVGVGAASGMSVRGWLILGLGVSLTIWVGGAVSGQILLARLLDRDLSDDWTQVLDYLRQLLWIIPRCYVPLGFVALGCGLGLVVVTGTSLTEPVVLIPLALYALTAVAGSAVSAPGYIRLIRLAEHRATTASDDAVRTTSKLDDAQSSDAAHLRARLLPLAWVNRIELALVLAVGFTLLASTV